MFSSQGGSKNGKKEKKREEILHVELQMIFPLEVVVVVGTCVEVEVSVIVFRV